MCLTRAMREIADDAKLLLDNRGANANYVCIRYENANAGDDGVEIRSTGL